jgi:hypothetical protein
MVLQVSLIVQKDMLALVSLLLLLLGSAATAGTEGGPRPPCGEAPRPAYSSPDAQPLVKVWSDERRSGAWQPPACTGWTPRDDTIIVALAGSFHHDGDAEDLLSRFGAVSAMTAIRYWSITDKAWQPLVTEATALSGPDEAQRRADFGIVDLAPGRDLFFAQSDNRSSGTVVYRMRLLEVAPERLVIQTENVTSVRLWLVPLFGPGEVQAV